jgi:hypothetical protein
MEVVGIRTEVETTFFRPYFRNPGFHRNCSVFNLECLPNLNRPTKGGPRREGTHLKKPSPSKSQPTQSPIAPHALALDSASSTRDSKESPPLLVTRLPRSKDWIHARTKGTIFLNCSIELNCPNMLLLYACTCTDH